MYKSEKINTIVHAIKHQPDQEFYLRLDNQQILFLVCI